MAFITSEEIASFLNLVLHGRNCNITRPADLSDCGPGDIIWIKGKSPERVAIANSKNPSLVICEPDLAPLLSTSYLVTANPRLAFIKVVSKWFCDSEHTIEIHPTAIVEPGVVIGKNVAIGPYSRVGRNVRIGDECVIGSGVSLEGNLELGKRCRIKSNAVLGAPGFGFERDENGVPLHFPHLGKIVLEDDVWIGACSTVERATLGTTRLCASVKVDDLVQIGHNTVTGTGTLVMSNVVICGGAQIGKNCWIAPNSVIKEKIKIGSNVVVGLGSVVIRDVADGLTVAGVPARALPMRSK